MSPLQRFLFGIAGAIGFLWLAGFPVEELRPVAWILSAFSLVGLVASLADGAWKEPG